MNANEIVRVLRACSETECPDCPLHKPDYSALCTHDAADLIERQEADIIDWRMIAENNQKIAEEAATELVALKEAQRMRTPDELKDIKYMVILWERRVAGMRMLEKALVLFGRVWMRGKDVTSRVIRWMPMPLPAAPEERKGEINV